ncbi:FRG domain-containing protein [Longitalea luteola]|uniref:FRG domain-containing protein n=1 Tax=Longitalea luteola TaxID=2812563 RepID=UPI001A96DD4F|nr:FRG domain-containing protein [Longitalea luteola]
MKEVTVETIGDYLSFIKQHKSGFQPGSELQDVVFRGQAGDFPLMPKLGRLHAKKNILEAEKQMLHEFKRSNPLLIQPHGALDDWDYLTLGQHFGLPTRLLDWSDNALTALWFAVTSRPGGYSQEHPAGIVWMLMAAEDDFVKNMNEIHPFEVPETKIFRPRLIKQRINNQSGIFSIHSSNDIVDKRLLNDNSRYQKKLVKMKIPAEKIPDLLNDLNTLGVNAFSIFPELEGLCSYLQWRFFE